MLEQFAATVDANLRFYRRSRLLLIIALVFVFVPALASIPTLFFMSSAAKFGLIQMMLTRALSTIVFFAGAIGILTIHHHLSNRSYRMVITKPCSPETWLLAHFASGMLVAAAMMAAALLGCGALFMLWHVPFQWGMLLVGLDRLGHILILFAELSFLSTVVHPIVALMVFVVIREETFYSLIVSVSAGLAHAQGAFKHFAYTALEYAMIAAYYILPSGQPFAQELAKLNASYRGGLPEAGYLGASLLYAVLVAAGFYFLGVLALKKRRMV